MFYEADRPVIRTQEKERGTECLSEFISRAGKSSTFMHKARTVRPVAHITLFGKATSALCSSHCLPSLHLVSFVTLR
eukprot:9657-Heterococcus_DN1.PRE.2